MNKFLIILVFVSPLYFTAKVFGQEKRQNKIFPMPRDSGEVVVNKDTTTGVPQKDIFDVVSSIFNKHKKQGARKKDTIISKPVYSFIPAIGYTLETETAVTLAGNITFRADSAARISTVSTNIGYTQNKQFTFPIESEIWTRDNKFNLVGDYRFYKYPQSTFGLGSNSNINNEDPMDYLYVRFYEIVYRHVVDNLFLGAGYIIDYHADITQKGNKDGTPSDYTAYGIANHTISSGFTFNTLFDGRDNSLFPSKGYYFNIQLRDNLKDLGSTSNWQSVIIDVRKYFNWPQNTHNVLALWSYNWLTLAGRPPYLDLPSTGWDPYSSTGRGYIQGRFRGTKEVYAEAEYRFVATRNGLFGGVVFVNGSSFSAGPGTGLQSIQPGFGPGLRIKLNKVSKTNVSIDYGFGREGSRGLFINVGELF
jgi:hypothetical protein